MIKYVAYYISPPQRRDIYWNDVNQLEMQQSAVQPFLHSDTHHVLIHSFIERGHYGKNRKDWNMLAKALDYCREHGAQLLLASFKKTITNTTFTNMLGQFLAEGHDLRACDYPHLSRENFQTLVEHACIQRQQHRTRILEGLQQPRTKKSGNPQAISVIQQVNLPKINNALIFSLYLQPLISPFLQQGLSQRQMIKTLNARQIYAPQGGVWVLSQFQKVLHRIVLNDYAFSYANDISSAQGLTAEAIAQQWNENPKLEHTRTWRAKDITEIQLRLVQLQTMTEFYEFALAIQPIFEAQPITQLTDVIFLQTLHRQNVSVPRCLQSVPHTQSHPTLFLELIIRMLSTSLQQPLPLTAMHAQSAPAAQAILRLYGKLQTQYAHLQPIREPQIFA